jgi:EAL domain-containing protein (putative c-di-GMP-specific phosphodiesterase class I)
VRVIRENLGRHGVKPSLLKLELTESVVLDNIEEVIDRMMQIKALGVTFALDDFGTGFSSLSYLKKLPLDQVKIDQSFVRDVTTDPSDAAIVRAILAMSQSLGMQAIAEGVETPEQLNFLAAHGCGHYQGYLFGKPMAIEEWPRMDKARLASLFGNQPS